MSGHIQTSVSMQHGDGLYFHSGDTGHSAIYIGGGLMLQHGGTEGLPCLGSIGAAMATGHDAYTVRRYGG